MNIVFINSKDYLYISAYDYACVSDWLEMNWCRVKYRITDPQLRGADCKSAPAAAIIGISGGAGPLTNRANLPYMRRSDLIDPTHFLNFGY